MKQKGFVILPMIILALLLIILGYIIYQTFQTKDKTSNRISPTFIPKAEDPQSIPVKTTEPDKCNSQEVYVRLGNDYECVEQSVFEDTNNWKIYTSNFNYTIKYPDVGIAYTDKYDFYRCLYGDPFLGGCVAVEILSNPDNLSLNELGNLRYATDAPEPYDLDWKPALFKGQEAITTTYRPPGDSVPQTIFIFRRNNTIFSVWSGSIDDDSGNSHFYQDFTEKMLSTFTFI